MLNILVKRDGKMLWFGVDTTMAVSRSERGNIIVASTRPRYESVEGEKNLTLSMVLVEKDEKAEPKLVSKNKV